jgi:Leucine-rich repeat (LRR) protein
MKQKITLILIWVLLPSISLAATDCQIQTEIPATECHALIALYDSTDGANWSNNTGWKVTNTPCSWYGVSCDGGNVTKLDFTWNSLNGTIPSELGNLANLTSLDMLGNQLSGTIPLELGNLLNLTALILGGNQLSGTIPVELGHLINLRELYLSNNQLSGTIPVELGHLVNLLSLGLFDNQLSGRIPSELSHLVNLRDLSLGGNQLSGTIPSKLGHLVNLKSIGIHGNQLSGSIPVELGNLVNLTLIWLSGNQLIGSIPVELANLVNLRDLRLNNNQLNGLIPPELGNLVNLTELKLDNNQLIGAIPSELGNLVNLKALELNNNQLSGSIPSKLGNLVNLTELELDNNQLSGELPSELGNLVNLTALELDNNQLSGELPSELGNLVNLIALELDNNQLSGNIPSELGNLVNLRYIGLQNNQLSGTIPSELSNLLNLTELWLSHNQLSGTIPSELGNLVNLKYLYLNNNQLSGTIPDFSHLIALEIADFGYNQLTAETAGSATAKDSDWAESQFLSSDRLSIEPIETRQVTVGQVIALSASGGNGKFIWTATEGTIQASGATATYTVPKEGVFYVWVSDGSDFAWALVDATHPVETLTDSPTADIPDTSDALVLLRIAPETLNLLVDETQAISVRGYLGDGSFIDLTTQAQLQIEHSEIAQVTNGQVTAKSVGATTLLARYQDRQVAIPVNVQEKTYRLRVEPDLIILPEGASQPIKVYEITQTAEERLFEKAEFKLCDLENAVALENCDAEIVSIENGIVTGLKTGSAWLSVRAGNTVLPISVLVVHSLPLDVTPAYATIDKGELVSFSVSGGEPPYHITDDKGAMLKTGEKENTFIYQSDQADTVVLTVTDALNNATQARVEIVGPLTVSPEQAVIDRQGQVALRASGGDGDYVWTATRGQVRQLSDNTVHYVAPKLVGLHTVTVIDGLGNSRDVLILISKDLAFSQQQLFLTPKETTQLRVLGGVHPYTVTATGGEVELESGLIRYTAPQVAGHYTMNLKDAAGHRASAEMTVALDLLISPVSGHLDRGESLTLHATGGFGKKRWGSRVGELNKTEGESVIWTAPDHIGPAFIYVSDAAGTLKKATIEVASPGLAITPSIRHSHPNETGDFTVTGGIAPYTWIAKQGEVPAEQQGNTITYTAPQIKGIDELTVQDAAGKTAQAQINVYTTQLLASPKTLSIHSGETLKIALSGGTGDYTLWAGLGVLSDSQIRLDGELYKTANYTALKNYKGHDTIHVLDSAGNQGRIAVEIIADIISAYAGPDGQLDEAEMNQALTDFFTGELDETALYWIAETFKQDEVSQSN